MIEVKRTVEPGCDWCEHSTKDPTQMPCRMCNFNYASQFKLDEGKHSYSKLKKDVKEILTYYTLPDLIKAVNDVIAEVS